MDTKQYSELTTLRIEICELKLQKMKFNEWSVQNSLQETQNQFSWAESSGVIPGIRAGVNTNTATNTKMSYSRNRHDGEGQKRVERVCGMRQCFSVELKVLFIK